MSRNSIARLTIEASRGNQTIKLAEVSEPWAGPAEHLVPLDIVPGLSSGMYQIRLTARLYNNQTVASDTKSIRVLDTQFEIGSFRPDTFAHRAQSGTGTIVVGGGGTDVLDLGVPSSSIASINGLRFSEFVQSPTTYEQAIYRGSVYDYAQLTDGREIYFQGIERLRLAGGGEYELAVHPNDPSFPSQWNLHVTDVPSAWRFGTGSNDVMLVSLDTGVALASGLHDLNRKSTYPNHSR